MAAQITLEMKDLASDGFQSIAKAFNETSASADSLQKTLDGVARTSDKIQDAMGGAAKSFGSLGAGGVDALVTLEDLSQGFELSGQAAHEASDGALSLSKSIRLLNQTGITRGHEMQLYQLSHGFERMLSLSPKVIASLGAVGLAVGTAATAFSLGQKGWRMLVEEGEAGAMRLESAFGRLGHSFDAMSRNMATSDLGRASVDGLSESMLNLGEMFREGWPTLKGSVALMFGFGDAAKAARGEIEGLRAADAKHREAVAAKATDRTFRDIGGRGAMAESANAIGHIDSRQRLAEIQDEARAQLEIYNTVLLSAETEEQRIEAQRAIAQWTAKAAAAAERETQFRIQNSNVAHDLARFQREVDRQAIEFEQRRQKLSVEGYDKLIAQKKKETEDLASRNAMTPEEISRRNAEMESLKGRRGTAMQDSQAFKDQQASEYFDEQVRLAEQGSQQEREIQRRDADLKVQLAKEEYERRKAIIESGEKNSQQAKEKARQDDLSAHRKYLRQVDEAERKLYEDKLARAKDEEERLKLRHEFEMGLAHRAEEERQAAAAADRAREQERIARQQQIAQQLTQGQGGGQSAVDRMQAGFTDKNIRRQMAADRVRDKAGIWFEGMTGDERRKAEREAMADIAREERGGERGVQFEGRRRGRAAMNDLQKMHRGELEGLTGDDRKEAIQRQREQEKALRDQIRGGGFDSMVRSERGQERAGAADRLAASALNQSAQQLGVNSELGGGLAKAAETMQQHAQLTAQQGQEIAQISQAIDNVKAILGIQGRGGASRQAAQRRGVR